MSLQLHYTGQDYINRGLAGGSLTPGSTSAIVGGCKTGKGFAFDGTVDSTLQVNATMSMPSEFTISCWAKVNNVVDIKTIWTNGGLYNSGFQIDFTNDIIRAFVYNTTDVAYIVETSSGFVETNKWYHIVAGIKDGKLFLYVNKVFVSNIAITGTLKTFFNPIIGRRADSGNAMSGQICNFKYYDHALSQKEINDDYRSLILHYPLKNENEISPYIALAKDSAYTIGNYTKTIIDDYDRITYSSAGLSANAYIIFYKLFNKYEDKQWFTLTFKAKINELVNSGGLRLRLARWSNDLHVDRAEVHVTSTEWVTYSLTQYLDSDVATALGKTLSPRFENYLQVYGNNSPISVSFDLKDIYATMGESILPYPITNTGSILDVSGFQRHITNLTNNTVTLDSKAQVYSSSLKNDGTQSLIGTSDLTDLNGLNEGSFSFRAFLTVNSLLQYVIYNMTDLIGGYGILFSLRNGAAVAYFYGTRIQFNYTPTHDAWHHVVLVKTSNQIKVYIDGVNIYTVSATTSSKNFSNITSISSMPNGSYPISEGNVQDIRFYATALTEDDVKDLYNVRHSIDKHGNYYTYELIEGETGVGMKRNGQTNCDEVIENDDGTFEIVQNKTIKTKQIKEI